MESTEFSKIISETKPIVLSAIRKNLAERFYDSIDEVVQEVYIRAYKALTAKKFRGDSNIRTWLYTIARNESLRMNKKLSREEEKIEKVKKDAREYSEEIEDDSWSFGKVKDLILKIPLKYSSVLLKVIEGKSEGKIAEELGIKQGTVKSRTSRGKKILKGIITQEKNL
ncbi:MAG: sigma-70 family RNA polymerase sigma factor [Leptospiraceae bacterium]|nr:sigma-70 family RNA polymerase sigma factor [Leptospiraceae bacterium]